MGLVAWKRVEGAHFFSLPWEATMRGQPSGDQDSRPGGALSLDFPAVQGGLRAWGSALLMPHCLLQFALEA